MALCILSVGDERGSLYAKVGDTLELHLTAAGKAMLAKLDDEDIAAVMGTGCYTVHTSNSIFNHFTLMRELKIVRENGYALERFENNSYSSAVASGFCDFDNRPCAISIGLIKPTLSRELKAVRRRGIRGCGSDGAADCRMYGQYDRGLMIYISTRLDALTDCQDSLR